MRLLLLTGLMATAFASSAQASNDAAPADAAAEPAAAPAQARKVCTSEKPVGSNRRVRVCRTVEEVEADRKAAQEALEGRKGDL